MNWVAAVDAILVLTLVYTWGRLNGLKHYRHNVLKYPRYDTHYPIGLWAQKLWVLTIVFIIFNAVFLTLYYAGVL